MKHYCYILMLIGLMLSSPINAQSYEEYRKRVMAEYDSYNEQKHKEFEEYRKRINAEYAEFMKRAWVKGDVQPEIPAPKPNPPAPPVYKPEDDYVAPVAVISNVAITPPTVKPLPKPMSPIPLTVIPKSIVEVSFFGAECPIHITKDEFAFDMRDNSERSVSAVWSLLSDGRADAMINDCFALRKELQLCDWAYYQLVKSISAEIYGNDTCNEAIVLQTFLMTQSGYKVRMGRTDDELRVLLSSDSTIYSTTYLLIGGVQFYLLQGTKGKPIFICDFEFPGEAIFSMKMDKLPILPVDEIVGRELQAKRYSNTKVVVNHNRNMIDFLATFPCCSIENYATASLDDEAKNALYPVLKKAIDRLPEDVAANILINFVQTAFEYKVDGEQFGRERTLFANETLYYPYSDCEDRALLFATLVRELMGLDVVLLDYPDHIATAVHFSEDVKGDYMMVDNKKYLVCDPTYIGATIGKAMPRYRDVTAGVVLIK